jgi:hypothetical protein
MLSFAIQSNSSQVNNFSRKSTCGVFYISFSVSYPLLRVFPSARTQDSSYQHNNSGFGVASINNPGCKNQHLKLGKHIKPI